MFARLLDITESREEKRAARLKKDFKRIFPADKQHLRWSHFRNEGGDRMLTIVRDEFFPFMRTNLQQHPLGRYLKDANCLIPSGNLLSRAVAAIEELPLTEGDAKGDIYEHLLSASSPPPASPGSSAPRATSSPPWWKCSIPKPTDTVCDPACGTGGFLISVMLYLYEKYSTPPWWRPMRRETNTTPATCSNPTSATSAAACSMASISTSPCSAPRP
jgi:type I restriction enzyme M protein